MKIVWDLDGVLRNLNGYLMKKFDTAYPTTWNFKYKGKTIHERIEEDLDILIKSPPTAYLKVALNQEKPIEIWTSQPQQWREKTLEWISNHLGEKTIVRFLTCIEKEKRLQELMDTLLIEDSPNFKNYKRILLIDYPYNQSIRKVIRIFGAANLKILLDQPWRWYV